MASTGLVKPASVGAIRLDRAAATSSRSDSISNDWSGRRVTVMGLGRHGGGVAAARYLARRGAQVTVSDISDRKTLGESLEQLRDVPIAAIKLGGHDPADFSQAEFVAVNPAVQFDHPLLQIARQSGAKLTSEIELFLRACPAQIIGVTGSNGKSTTCSMIAAILSAAGRRTWLGGNIGRSLLGELSDIRSQDWIVLELSSFQLAHLSDGVPMPRFVVVTNCTPNHLDWHGEMTHYIQAKQRLVRELPADGIAVLNAADIELGGWGVLAGGRTRASWASERIPALGIPGEHNRQNAGCAAAVAQTVGVEEATICRALSDFRTLDHRLQFVAKVAGRKFYNDSKSTTPEAALAALAALVGPVWLLAGGHAKGASFAGLARAVVGRARGASLFGAARNTIQACIRAERSDFETSATEHLADALRWCWLRSQPGDAILLSPACASLDQFRDFEARGQNFCRLVEALQSRARQ